MQINVRAGRRIATLAVLSFASAITLGGCATTKDQTGQYPSSTQAFSPTAERRAELQYDASMATASDSYEAGDAQTAEIQFSEIVRRQPTNSRAIYNLAMIRLQLAYDGLERFRQLEPDARGSASATRVMNMLATVARR